MHYRGNRVRFTGQQQIFSVQQYNHISSAAHILPIKWIAERITWVKTAQREGQRSRKDNAKVKNEWSFTYTATL
jgi:hypothetical protein